MFAPDVGSIVVDTRPDPHNPSPEPHRWRVDSWMREVEPTNLKVKENTFQDVIANILVESLQLNKKDMVWQWCSRKDATHVCCSGVSGSIIPIEYTKVVGNLKGKWTDKMIADQRNSAISLIGRFC